MKKLKAIILLLVVSGALIPALGDGINVKSVELPDKSVPLKYQLAVEPKGRLDIGYVLESVDMTNSNYRAAILLVKYLDNDGKYVKSAELTWSSMFKCDYQYIEVGPGRSIFNKTLAVPEKATSVELGMSRFLSHESIRLVRLRCNFIPKVSSRFHMKIVSIWFIAFVSIVFLVYFAMPGFLKPWILLLSSVLFYSFFNLYAFFFLCASALSIWLGGLWLHNSDKRCGAKLALMVCFNIGLLLVAKYFVPSVNGIYAMLGDIAPSISIVLPLGISFYSLQAVSYCWDVYRKDLQPERNFFKLFHYLIFFPTIMQGPISRYGQIGHQLWSPHGFSWDRMQSGLELALWGFFKKMVIADRAAMMADAVFAPGATMEGFPVLLGVLCYSVQIYADFSGCVDICRGICEVMGINLIENFKHPYFATSIKDFWRRWHIALSSWLRDYVYIPLGGNRNGVVRKYLNVLIVFGVSGIWHGVGINFFIWGLLHGVYQVMDALTDGIRKRIVAFCRLDENAFSFRFGQRIWTFALVTFAWIFFRAPTLADAWSVIKRMCVFNPWTLTDGSYLKHGLDAKDFDVLVLSLAVLLVVSIMQERFKVREWLAGQMLWFRWSIYLLAVFGTLILGVYGPGYNASQFIYMGF